MRAVFGSKPEDPPANAIARLQHGNGETRLLQQVGRHQARQAGSHNHHRSRCRPCIRDRRRRLGTRFVQGHGLQTLAPAGAPRVSSRISAWQTDRSTALHVAAEARSHPFSPGPGRSSARRRQGLRPAPRNDITHDVLQLLVHHPELLTYLFDATVCPNRAKQDPHADSPDVQGGCASCMRQARQRRGGSSCGSSRAERNAVADRSTRWPAESPPVQQPTEMGFFR